MGGLFVLLASCSAPPPVVAPSEGATVVEPAVVVPAGPACAHERECAGTDLCIDAVCVADPGPALRSAPIPTRDGAPPPPDCEPWSDADRLAAVQAGRTADDAAFPYGAMSAAVREDRATIWTRTDAPATVRVRASAGPACEAIVSPWQETDRAGGLVAQLALEGLRPDTRYRYTLELRGDEATSSPGFLRTLPRADDDVPLRLAIGADLSARPSMHGLVDELAESEAELLLWLGDWPYADADRDAKTLDEFREKHLETRRALPVQRLMRAMPIHAVWDDHEVTNDWDGRTGELQPELVANGIAAWREFFPIAGAPAGEIYRHYRVGRGLEVFHLDLRSHRDANTADDSPAKSMLGEAQREWLLEGLTSSEATFKLVLLSVPLDWGTTGKDHWVGFVHERELLLERIVAERLEGVVFLSGDQHWLAVHHLPEGPKVFQTGALAQTPRRPLDRVPPQVVLQHKALSFGRLDYAPGDPATLTFTAVANRRQSREDTGDPVELYRETLQAGAGRIYLEPPAPGLDWRLEGAHTFAGHGPADLVLAPPGEYRLSWRALAPGAAVPEASEFALRAGGKITLAPALEAAPQAAPLFFETFDELDEGLAARWTAVDECVEGEPAWQLWDGRLREAGNCYDADDEPSDPAAAKRYRAREKHLRAIAPAKRGTWLRANAPSFGDGTFGARVAAWDNDAFGLMYAVELDASGSASAYYRVSLDAQRELLRLVRHDAGRFDVLAEDRHFQLPLRQWHHLSIERDGPRHTVRLDGEVVLQAEEEARPLGPGAIALYSWGMDDVRFDDVHVSELPTTEHGAPEGLDVE